MNCLGFSSNFAFWRQSRRPQRVLPKASKRKSVANSDLALHHLRHAPARGGQHLAREDSDRMHHLVMVEIAKGELADEIVRAGLLRHVAQAIADSAGRARDC